ncbi:hypothetical protein [Halorubrum sp. SY-15]|jgi:hypothetical protein|uniref:hypothetical protein n=1 Tax=Halorubrum sp. SY-15 TaxID=3402277 RepID=UPI003EBB281E
MTELNQIRRRDVLAGLSTVGLGTIAGCTGSETPDSSNEETDDGSGNTEADDGSGVPEPEENWQQGLPHCSTGDYTLKIRGLLINYSGQTVTVNIENTGIEAREIEEVGIKFEYITDGDRNEIYDELFSASFSGRVEGGDTQSYEVSDFSRVFWEDADIEDVRLFLSSGNNVQPCWGDG